MRYAFLLMAALYIGSSIHAQNTPVVESYDLIYMRDSRGILKGEILVFDEEDGDIVFLDTEGRKYSITRYEYDYFIEDKIIIVNNNDTLIINPRKEHGAEISLGLVGGFVNLNQTVQADDYYLDGNTGIGFLPVGFKLSLGKYLNRQNFVGITADLGMIGEAKSYLNGGFRYLYQYPGYDRNIAFYLPLELQFCNLSGTVNYTTSDTTFVDGGFNYPSYKDIETSIQSIGLHVGQGMAFILPDKRSIKIELSLMKNFILSERYHGLNGQSPNSTFSQSGLRLGIMYCL